MVWHGTFWYVLVGQSGRGAVGDRKDVDRNGASWQLRIGEFRSCEVKLVEAVADRSGEFWISQVS